MKEVVWYQLLVSCENDDIYIYMFFLSSLSPFLTTSVLEGSPVADSTAPPPVASSPPEIQISRPSTDLTADAVVTETKPLPQDVAAAQDEGTKPVTSGTRKTQSSTSKTNNTVSLQ